MSSRFADVKREVLDQVKTLKGYLVGKYEVEKTDVDQNAKKFAKLLQDGDTVISAGGDATGVIAVNAILQSSKDVLLAVLPFGNFNDLSRTLGTKKFTDIISAISQPAHSKTPDNHKDQPSPAQHQTFFPLEIYVNDKFFRYATCYVTIGMTAEAVKLYDQPKMRKVLKTASGRNVGSYTNLASWYFKNRHKKQFLPDFRLNGVLQPKKTSDYAAVNGRYMARVMRGGEEYKRPHIFRSQTDRLTSFWRLFKLMFRSIFFQIPGRETKRDVLELLTPATIEIQAEGEYKSFDNVKKIEIRKSDKCLKMIKV